MSLDRDPNVYNQPPRADDRPARGSRIIAYLLGGLVVGLALLGFFLFGAPYDGRPEVSTTGAIGTPSTFRPVPPGSAAPESPTGTLPIEPVPPR